MASALGSGFSVQGLGLPQRRIKRIRQFKIERKLGFIKGLQDLRPGYHHGGYKVNHIVFFWQLLLDP